MQFVYQARDASGVVRDGLVTSTTLEEATLRLRQDGLYLLSINEKTSGSSKDGPSLFAKRVKRADIIYLTNQLAVMIDSGVPLATALESLAKQGDNPTLQSMLARIQKDVESGDDLSSALKRFPKYFDRTYVNLVRASEASGALSAMLERISEQSSTELETAQKVKGALTYPAAMLLMCVSVSIFLLTFVFPKLMPMFSARAIDVPLPTKVMIALSTALTGYWYLFVVAVILIVGFLIWARKQPWGRMAFDWVWLNLPVLGPLIRKVTISRSIRTLATTVNAGVPMLEALELCGGVSNNTFYEQVWEDVGDKVTGGKTIHEALEGNRLFPQTLLQMISSGEQTGKLGLVLDKVSDYYDREVANAVKTATSLIEPIMVVVMGSVIGTIALAMLLPIFKLSAAQH